MIDKALSNMFKVITEEATNNPAFGKKLEDSLAKFGQDLAEKRLAERASRASTRTSRSRSRRRSSRQGLRSSMRRSCAC